MSRGPKESAPLYLGEVSGLKRTHWCGRLSADQVGLTVVVMGWVHRTRDHGNLIFVDLRDRSGIVQLVFNPSEDRESWETAKTLRGEYVVAVEGPVVARDPERVNPNLPTGEIEIAPTVIRVLNPSATPPIYVENNQAADETLRLRFRYLDLRRPEMQEKLVLRHRVVKVIRDFMDSEGFLEIETPMLTRSTPEGARDYLVPSRVNPGKFYALPQSPQLFKQLLMVAGMERYFQIVRCFRDEDLRADRQPEFTQVDIEMSFIEVKDILDVTERMVQHAYRQALGIELALPFPRLTYGEAMRRFGSDKPDLRFGLELKDLTDVLGEADFQVFRKVVEEGGRIFGLNARGCGHYSRKEIDKLGHEAVAAGAAGLAWIVVEPDGIRSPLGKFLGGDTVCRTLANLEAEPGDLLLFVADQEERAATALGHLRLIMGRRLGLIPRGVHAFCWVTDFPLLEYDDEEGRWVSKHHPFTSPRDEDLDHLESEPGTVRARAYDLVLNGTELGSGSIRIHRRQVQERVFRTLGLGKEEAEAKFGFLLEAFEYGAPPHGGIALGLDRLLMLMSGATSMRDVIAFPKTARATCPLTGAPTEARDEQLLELNLRLKTPKI